MYKNGEKGQKISIINMNHLKGGGVFMKKYFVLKLAIIIILFLSGLLYPVHAQEVKNPKSETTALLWSLGATTIPAMFAYLSREEVNPLIPIIPGIIIGPSAGHFYSEQWGRGIQSVAYRAVIGSVGAFLSFAAAFEENGSESNVYAVIGVTGAFLVISALHDIFTAPSSARKYNTPSIGNDKRTFIFNIELSAPLIPNSKINLEVSPPAIKNLIEHELSSKGFVVVSEGEVDYIIRFLQSLDKNNRLIGFTLNIINSSTDKIVGVANFQSDQMEEIYITDVIKEFVNQLCQDTK